MLKIGDRVAVIHLHRAGRERRREAVRIDTVEKVTPKQIVTKSGQSISRSSSSPVKITKAAQ